MLYYILHDILLHVLSEMYYISPEAALRVGLPGTGPPSFVFGPPSLLVTQFFDLLSFLARLLLCLAYLSFLCLAHPVFCSPTNLLRERSQFYIVLLLLLSVIDYCMRVSECMMVLFLKFVSEVLFLVLAFLGAQISHTYNHGPVLALLVFKTWNRHL